MLAIGRVVRNDGSNDSFSPPISMQECGVHVCICMLGVWESVPVPVSVCM